MNTKTDLVLYGISLYREDPVVDYHFGGHEITDLVFGLRYDEINEYYYFEFDTCLEFDGSSDAPRQWLIRCYEELTHYMETHHYNVSVELDMYDVLINGTCVNDKFKSPEDAYAWLKFAVNGFHGKGVIYALD